jgi:RHS repeat-associated protein
LSSRRPDAGQLTGISHVEGENTLAFVEYTMDYVGNRTERVDQLGTHSYTYDDLYRLTQVTYPGPSTTSYTYDAVGNRETLEDGSGTTAYDYDHADQLTSVTPPGQQAIEYSWDDNGNLSQRGADTYDWDAGDKMTSATVGVVTTDMAYNGDGLRDSRTVGEATVTFTWDVARSIPQVIDDGSLAYVYGLGRISQVAADDTTYYYLSDGLGSTMALTDADGDVVNTYDYDVFGAVRASSGSQPNEFRFTGEQADDSTALEYLRARYYDPAVGRLLSQDPLPFLQRYGYVGSNPVRYIDPLGLDCSVSPLDWGDCAGDVVEGARDVGGAAIDTAAIIPYGIYYVGYEGLRLVNETEPVELPPGLEPTIVKAGLFEMEVEGLAGDVALDWLKDQLVKKSKAGIWDEGYEGSICPNPVEKSLSWVGIQCPRTYLPGLHKDPDPSGKEGKFRKVIDWQWPR